MTVLFALLSIALSMMSAFYLLLPTFILPLGYAWFHKFEYKRWIMRGLSLMAYGYFLGQIPNLTAIIFTSIPFLFFWIVSLFNANPNIFKALTSNFLQKSQKHSLNSETEVLGFEGIKGTAMAYPLAEMIIPHHLIRDTIDGQEILISFCAACRSAIVYLAKIDNQALHFEVVGVYRRNMLIRDVQTGTLWQQSTGEAVYGALKGKFLEMLPYQCMNLAEWQKMYPQTYIASEAKNAPKGLIPLAVLSKMLQITEKFHTPGRTNLGKDLPLREKIWAVEVGGISRAYPISELKKKPIFTDKIGTQILEIQYNPKNNHIKGYFSDSQIKLHFQSHWWFGWKEFHPHTTIWRASQY